MHLVQTLKKYFYKAVSLFAITLFLHPSVFAQERFMADAMARQSKVQMNLFGSRWLKINEARSEYYKKVDDVALKNVIENQTEKGGHREGSEALPVKGPRVIQEAAEPVFAAKVTEAEKITCTVTEEDLDAFRELFRVYKNGPQEMWVNDKGAERGAFINVLVRTMKEHSNATTMNPDDYNWGWPGGLKYLIDPSKIYYHGFDFDGDGLVGLIDIGLIEELTGWWPELQRGSDRIVMVVERFVGSAAGSADFLDIFDKTDEGTQKEIIYSYEDSWSMVDSIDEKPGYRNDKFQTKEEELFDTTTESLPVTAQDTENLTQSKNNGEEIETPPEDTINKGLQRIDQLKNPRDGNDTPLIGDMYVIELAALEENVKRLKAKKDRDEMEEALLTEGEAIIRDEEYMDDKTKQEFVKIMRLVNNIDTLKGILTEVDFKTLSTAMKELAESHTGLYRQYLVKSAEAYEKLAGVLGISLNDIVLPEKYKTIGLSDREKLKIMVDIEIKKTLGKDKTLLTGAERVAMDIYNKDLLPLRKEYEKQLKCVLEKFMFMVKRVLTDANPVSILEKKDRFQAVFILNDRPKKPAT
ncbi:MAG: hypothetical protein PHS37_07395 [Candidatus Omnitrophica bacterium]|nr:hypothetical protein [Candidatus Omnitrophota bacterium]